jgi:hypothetical protein
MPNKALTILITTLWLVCVGTVVACFIENEPVRGISVFNVGLYSYLMGRVCA